MERTVEYLRDRVAVLETQASQANNRINILEGTQNVYVDNYVGMKIKIDLLAKDLCPQCNFDAPTIKEPKVIPPGPIPEPIDDSAQPLD